jgi:hypothetical protein
MGCLNFLYSEIQSRLSGITFLCGGRSLLAAALMYHVTPPPRPDQESQVLTTRHPGYQPWKTELKRYSELLSDFAPSAQTFVECVLTPAGDMYFLESNARPGGHTALFSSFNDPLDGLLCMEQQDHAMLAQHLQDIDVGVELGIVLRHTAKTIPVDFALLDSLPGFRFIPLSVLPDDGGYVSHRIPIPSSLVMEAATPEEAFQRLQEVAPLIQRAGDFLPINLERVRVELFG